MKFQGKCNHCGKYGHKEVQCWAKHGRPGRTEDQVNQAVEDANDDEEEMVLMAWSSGMEEVDENNDDEGEEQQDQEPDPPRPRQVERNPRGGRNAAAGRGGPARGRRIEWNPRQRGWGAGPRNIATWLQARRPRSNGRSYITREGEEKKEDSGMAVIEDEMALGSPSEIDKMDTSLWLGDTGASCHMTNSSEGMFNQVKTNSGIVFGNGQRLKAEFIGDKKGTVIQKNGARVPILMKNVKYVPQLYCNLFSITAALREGSELRGNIKSLRLIKGRRTYEFDRRVRSGKAALFAIKINSHDIKKKP